MALSFRQARQLRGIERSLRRSEPGWTAQFEDFSRLSLGKSAGSRAEPCSSTSPIWLLLSALASTIGRGWLTMMSPFEGLPDPRWVGL